MNISTNDIASSLQSVLEQFYAQLSSVGFGGTSDDFVTVTLSVEVPGYISRNTNAVARIERIIKTHLTTTHAIQPEEISVFFYARKNFGDLDDYISRSY